MCKKHGKPIFPCHIRKGYTGSGCSKCLQGWSKKTRIRLMSDKMKHRREKEHDYRFIGCIHHPERRCNRSAYKASGGKYCGTCLQTNKATGETYEYVLKAQKKYKESGQKYWYLKSWRRKRKLMGAY